MLNSIKKAFNNTVQGAKNKIAEKALEHMDFNDPKVKAAMDEQIDKMGVPPQFKQMFQKLIQNSPELLIKISKEIQDEISKGKGQMQASQSIMMKYQKELREAMMK